MKKLICISLSAFILLGCNPNTKSKEHNHQHEDQKTIYTCPMHPEIREDKPGLCPICNMALVKLEEKTDIKKDELKVSKYQTDLIDIKPIKVKEKKVDLNIPMSGRVLSSSRIAFQIFETDIQYVKIGTPFTGSSSLFPDKKYFGKITNIDSMLDPTSRTLRIVGTLSQTDSKLLFESSFFGNLNIDLGTQMIIPETSVLFTGKGAYAYLYQDNNLKPKKIILGQKLKDSYIVLKGLSLGDQISSGPNFLIDSESKIRGLND